MDDPQEYEVESVTRARVHDKRGKKITWKYYVKWKGYGWDENTWEPTDSFQGGSEHILESFWERIDTGGRDISDATLFKKGEELLVSGPPGKKNLKRKASSSKTVASPFKNAPSSPNMAISAPLPRKRRRVQAAAEDERKPPSPRRKASTGGSKNGGKPPRRRRASSPGPRKPVSKRQQSVDGSQLDADGETDPDVVEVEDELMQVSAGDAEEDAFASRRTTATGSANGSKNIAFEDLQHFYSGRPIDIHQHMDEQLAVQKSEDRLSVHSPPVTPPPDDIVPDSQPSDSPLFGSPDPLFDSPPRFNEQVPESQDGSVIPPHRARAAKPLVKLIDAATTETTGRQTRITTKARLLLNPPADEASTGGPSRNTSRRGGKSGPGPFPGLLKKNRSSLLTAAKGALKTIKGNFVDPSTQRDQPDEIEETPPAGDTTEGNALHITSWSDEDRVVDREGSQPSLPLPPSGEELLKLAGQQTDPESLPDYEEEVAVAQPQEVGSPPPDPMPKVAKEEPLSQHSIDEVTERPKASEDATGILVTATEAEKQVSTSASALAEKSSEPIANLDETVKKNIELAKEHLFPSASMSSASFSAVPSSFQTTIFGPLYQGYAKDQTIVAENERTTTFKVILGDGGAVPLVLKDCSEIKARISEVRVGKSKSSGNKVAIFYSAADALAIASTLKCAGTARVALDPSAETMEQERFSVLLQRFESSQTLAAPVGAEVCVFYSSENADMAERLGVPQQLRGLSNTILISHTSIENQLAYVAAIMQATTLD